MPDGALCVCGGDRLHFLNAQYEAMPDGHAWTALAQWRAKAAVGVLQHENALLVVDYLSDCVLRLRISDAVELARSPVLDAPSELQISGIVVTFCVTVHHHGQDQHP